MAENSVITDARRINLCNATSKGSGDYPVYPITTIVFGDGGVDENGDPIPPIGSQTTLTHQIASYPLSEDVIYPLTTTAEYKAIIPESDLVGESISEAGLVDSQGTLCAVKTFYAKRKDDGVTFSFTFDDEF